MSNLIVVAGPQAVGKMTVAEKFGWLSNYRGANSADAPSDLASVNHWAYSSVENAFKSGIIQGSGDGIQPFEYSKRSECIKIIETLISQYF